MSNTEDDLEIISENGVMTSDEWFVKILNNYVYLRKFRVKECGTASLISTPEESEKNVKNMKKHAANFSSSAQLRTERWIV